MRRSGISVLGAAWRFLLALAAVLVVSGLLAPFVNASVFQTRIQTALEGSLGRRVSFGKVHFTLFSGPGFSLTDVVIEEDPRYGLEPFASVPTLEARVRVGSFLRGRLAFSSLQLDDPSLNIVKLDDGSWNVVELLSRLTAPSRLPVDLFPVFSVSSGRLDFKLGTQKTTLYVTNTDISVYPERLGKLYVRFSGSPARTDRAGIGLGHMQGTANWYLQPRGPQANQLEASVALEPSNFSELTQLIAGHDIGVHGTISAHTRIEGPLSALRVSGSVRLGDVHRWDLLASAGEEWRIGYSGNLDLQAHSLLLQTVSSRGGETPVSLQVRVTNLMSNPAWSMNAVLQSASAAELLPIGKRMGLAIPDSLKLEGTVDGAVGYAPQRGLSGAVEVKNVTATLPNLPALRTASLEATFSADNVHVEPAQLETGSLGSMQVGGDYDSAAHAISVTLRPLDFPVDAARDTVAAWFGLPDAFNVLHSGVISGRIDFKQAETTVPAWSGDLHFDGSDLQAPGMAQPLTNASGHVAFTPQTLNVDRLEAEMGGAPVTASYHYSEQPGAWQRLDLHLPSADLHDFETALAPTLRDESLLTRLGVSSREIPSWLAHRRLQAALNIDQFSIDGTILGTLHTRVSWAGPEVQFSSFELKMPDGLVKADGTLDLSSKEPIYNFSGAISGYRWRGGMLGAEGTLTTSGVGTTALANLRAEGTFSGQDVTLSSDELFRSVGGMFDFSLGDGWLDLRVSDLKASQGDEIWTGNAASRTDGTLVLDLQHAGQQRHVVSSLEPQSLAVSSASFH